MGHPIWVHTPINGYMSDLCPHILTPHLHTLPTPMKRTMRTKGQATGKTDTPGRKGKDSQ